MVECFEIWSNGLEDSQALEDGRNVLITGEWFTTWTKVLKYGNIFWKMVKWFRRWSNMVQKMDEHGLEDGRTWF